MVWGAIISGAASLAGGYMQNEANKSSASAANDYNYQWFKEEQAFNAEEALKNRTWQRQMSDTAVRRQVRDMKKAGINPILAAQYGGASTPSGSQASVKAPQAVQPRMEDIVTDSVATANQWRQGTQAIQLQKQQQEKVAQETQYVMQDTKFKKATTDLTEDQRLKVAEEIGYIRQQVKHVKATTKGQEQFNELKEVIVGYVQSGQLQTLAREAGVGINMIIDLVTDSISDIFGKMDKTPIQYGKDSAKNLGNTLNGYKEKFKSWMRETRQNYENSQ